MFKQRMLACYDRQIEKKQEELSKIQDETNEIIQSKKAFENIYANLNQSELEEINLFYAAIYDRTEDELMTKNLSNVMERIKPQQENK